MSNDGFVDECMQDLLNGAVAAMHGPLADIQDDIEQSIDIECPAYHARLDKSEDNPHEHTHHSPRGGPPYLETGNLHDSINRSAEVGEDGPDTVTGQVFTDVFYAAYLEDPQHHDRPFFGPAADRAFPDFVPRLVSEWENY